MEAEVANQLEKELENLREIIDENPDEESLLKLAEELSRDHETIQEALQYADIPHEKKKELLRVARER